jgi:hypothetical protein
MHFNIARVVDRSSVARSLTHSRASFSNRTTAERRPGTRLKTNAKAANDVEKLNSLQLWLEGLGSDFDTCGVRLKLDDDEDGFGVRGVAHGQSIARGSELVRVPREAFITADVARSRLDSLLVQHSDEKKSCAHDLSNFQCLELFLLCEKNIGSDSSWEPYLSLLPDMLEHPMLWEDFSLLRRETRVGYNLLERIDACRRDFEAFQKLQWSSVVKPNITELDVRWATAILTSRAFHLSLASECDDDFDDDAEFLAKFADLDEDVWEPAGDDEHNPDGEMVLVPWADALNHSPDAGSESILTYSSLQRVATLIAHRDYEQGAQVFDSYGVNLSATESFINYGFVDPQSHRTDFVEFPGDVFLAAAKAKGLKAATDTVDLFSAIKIEETIFRLDPSTGIDENTLFYVSDFFEEESVDDSTILEIFRQLCANKELALAELTSSREDVDVPPRRLSLTGRSALDYVLSAEHDAVRALCTKIAEQLVAQKNA